MSIGNPPAAPIDIPVSFDCGHAAGEVVDKSSRQARGDDRVLSIQIAGDRFYFLADGATGMGFGGDAAEAACRSLARIAGRHNSLSGKLDSVLAIMDRDVADACIDLDDADTTGILVTCSGRMIEGASAGDSKAILVYADREIDLTAGQHRKPRLGSGARPMAFSHEVSGPATLVMASDGLWDFCRKEDVLEVVRSLGTPGEKVDLLIGLAASETGEFGDDVSVIVVAFG